MKDIPAWGNYLSYLSSLVALVLSIYNFRKSLVRLRVEMEIYPTEQGCWVINAVVENNSSRSVSIIRASVVSNNRTLNSLSPRATKGDFLVYMHSGFVVASTTTPLTLPLTINAYDAKPVELIISENPNENISYFVIRANGKDYRTRLPHLQQQ